MRLSERFSLGMLEDMLRDGYVRRYYHPTEPLAGLNYTEKCSFDRAWNEVTLACRGLIYNTDTMEVVARPFDKFFNYEELGPAWLMLHLDDWVHVTDKVDGSMGILYREPSTGLLALATRGSFTSDQALHGTQVLRETYKDFVPVDGSTYLFEIIYPENRIVLNYSGMDDLVLLGVVDNRFGDTFTPDTVDWDGPKVEVFGTMQMKDAINLPDRENAEGVVINVMDTDIRVKVKQADYVALHRIVTGMNDRAVWLRLLLGASISDIQRDLPEEFWQWVEDTAQALLKAADSHVVAIWDEFSRIERELGPDFSRREFAALALKSEYRAELFLALDGKSVSVPVWKRVRPEAGRSMTAQSEG